MTRWFTSDHHFGHVNIIDFSNRPFNSVNHMNEVFVQNINEDVAEDDEIYFVGDVFMGDWRENLIEYGSRMNGTKYIIPGNHDKVFCGRKGWRKNIPFYENAGFTVLEQEVVIEINGSPFLLCHFPRAMDKNDHRYNPHHVDKFSPYRPDGGDMVLIHGHTHSSSAISGDRQIHVGVDAWDHRPVREDWIYAMAEKRGWVDPLDPQCGCGEPIERLDGGWVHIRRRLDKTHPASLQLELTLTRS